MRWKLLPLLLWQVFSMRKRVKSLDVPDLPSDLEQELRVNLLFLLLKRTLLNVVLKLSLVRSERLHCTLLADNRLSLVVY